MVEDITLIIGALDLSSRLLTYNVTKETQYSVLVTTRDGYEHGVRYDRDVITFTVFPPTQAQNAELYTALSTSIFSVTYTDPHRNADETAQFRLASDMDAVFGIKSINGNKYYKGGEIVLRRLDADANRL